MIRILSYIYLVRIVFDAIYGVAERTVGVWADDIVRLPGVKPVFRSEKPDINVATAQAQVFRMAGFYESREVRRVVKRRSRVCMETAFAFD